MQLAMLSARTHCIAEHCKAPQSSDRLSEVLLCIVQLLYVPADFLHHQLTLLCFPSNIIDLPKQLLNRRICIVKILPAKEQLYLLYLAGK